VKAAPGQAPKALADLRAAMAERPRPAADDFAGKKQELVALRGELTEQFRRLADERRAMERWAAERQEEIDRVASELSQRKMAMEREDSDRTGDQLRGESARLDGLRKLRMALVNDSGTAI